MVDLALLQSVSYMAGALGVLVAAVYYVYNMRVNQKTMKTTLETRQTQLFMQLLTLYNSRDFMNDYARVAYETQYENLEDWVKKYGPQTNREYWSSWGRVGRFFDGTGILVRKGLIDADLVIDEMRELILLTWDKVKPWVLEARVKMNSPHTWENFEFLAGEARRRHADFISADDWNTYEKEVIEADT